MADTNQHAKRKPTLRTSGDPDLVRLRRAIHGSLLRSRRRSRIPRWGIQAGRWFNFLLPPTSTNPSSSCSTPKEETQRLTLEAPPPKVSRTEIDSAEETQCHYKQEAIPAALPSKPTTSEVSSTCSFDKQGFTCMLPEETNVIRESTENFTPCLEEEKVEEENNQSAKQIDSPTKAEEQELEGRKGKVVLLDTAPAKQRGASYRSGRRFARRSNVFGLPQPTPTKKTKETACIVLSSSSDENGSGGDLKPYCKRKWGDSDSRDQNRYDHKGKHIKSINLPIPTSGVAAEESRFRRTLKILVAQLSEKFRVKKDPTSGSKDDFSEESNN